VGREGKRRSKSTNQHFKIDIVNRDRETSAADELEKAQSERGGSRERSEGQLPMWTSTQDRRMKVVIPGRRNTLRHTAKN